MKLSLYHLIVLLLVGISVGYLLKSRSEGFHGGSSNCGSCGNPVPCGCPMPKPNCVCEPCPAIDYSKYVLKATIPPCPQCPDMSQYMLKSECPSVPDLSAYVLRSSIPKPTPVILDCSKCNKPKRDPAPCPRPYIPTPIVKCKAEEPVSSVRPFLSPLNFSTFGTG